MYKVLIPIEDTFKALRWCKANFGPLEPRVVIHRHWRKGGTVFAVDREKARWYFCKNKLTSRWVFKNEDDAIYFKLVWYRSVDKKK